MIDQCQTRAGIGDAHEDRRERDGAAAREQAKEGDLAHGNES